MKLRNANGGFISPASSQTTGSRCMRTAEQKTAGVPRVKELQQRAKRSAIKKKKKPGLLLSCSFIKYEFGVIARRTAELQSRALFTRLSWEAYCVEAVKYSLSDSLAGFHAACL